MGRALAESHLVARRAFETADRVLGFPLSKLCWEGPAGELTETQNTQPALLTHSMAALGVLEEAGLRPTFAAGHSLGEYSACVAAGVLSFEDGLKLTRARGELMRGAGRERPGTMAAVLGLPPDQVEAACREAGGTVVAANFNAPGQIVISGEIEAVEGACRGIKERGGKARRLEVDGAFHSPLMGSAAQALAERLDRTAFRDARCPVVVNVSARPLTSGDDIRSALKDQLLGAVRWEDSMRLLIAQKPTAFIEVGTGKVLRGLLRKIDSQAASWNVDDLESLKETLSALRSNVPMGQQT
jgi:[acyl-carrier-protein] S-malonyltransferase